MGSIIASHNRRIIQVTSIEHDAIVQVDTNVHLIINI